MKRLPATLGLMIVAITAMLIDLVWHSPLTMSLFLGLASSCTAAATVLFFLDVRAHLRVQVTVVDDDSGDKAG